MTPEMNVLNSVFDRIFASVQDQNIESIVSDDTAKDLEQAESYEKNKHKGIIDELAPSDMQCEGGK